MKNPFVEVREVIDVVDCKVEAAASHIDCEETEDVITILHRSVEIAETSDLVNEALTLFNMFSNL